MMKNISVFAVLTGIFFINTMDVNAAYPVYPSYQRQQQYGVQQYQQQYQQPTQVMNQNANMVYIPQQTGIQSSNVSAANPTRITGTLPRVGTAATTAGRQYYQPADFDRLADSGLYIGLSAAYSANIMGSMLADYIGEEKSWFVPGAFQSATFDSDTVIPLQVSMGAAINNDVRVDFSFTRYSGISYPNMVQSSNGIGGYLDAQVDGGAITANTTMLNVYYNIDSYTGYLAGGALRPYIGAGVGISLNTIADYVVYDNTFYSEMDPRDALAGELTGVSDVFAYHNGGTSEQLAFMLEGGVTTELGGGIKLDFFVRYANVGKVKTSGSIVVSQTEWLGDGAGGEYQAPYDSVFHYTNWYESGRLSTVDLGIRARLQF